MDLDTILLECEERMQKSVDYLQRELRGLRTGRASTALQVVEIGRAHV